MSQCTTHDLEVVFNAWSVHQKPYTFQNEQQLTCLDQVSQSVAHLFFCLVCCLVLFFLVVRTSNFAAAVNRTCGLIGVVGRLLQSNINKIFLWHLQLVEHRRKVQIRFLGLD